MADSMILSGFTGLDCEMNTDDCVRHQCQNGATCLDGLGTYTCLCPKTWKGESSRANAGWWQRPLPPSQCQPSSPVLSPAGWDCSEDVDECEAQGPPRCRNGGTCQNSAGGFHCVCVSGWGGPGCDQNLDDCAAATCAPGSTCIDRVGSFSCLCPPGRTGAGRGCGGGDVEGENVPGGHRGVPSSLQEPCPSVSHRPPVPPGRRVLEPAMPWECPVQHQPPDRLFPLLMPAWLLGTHLPPGSG